MHYPGDVDADQPHAGFRMPDEDDVLWPDSGYGDPDGGSELVHPALERTAGLLVETDQLRHVRRFLLYAGHVAAGAGCRGWAVSTLTS